MSEATIDKLRLAAEEHAKLYPTFNLARFMRWISSQPILAQRFWLGRGIAKANKTLHRRRCTARMDEPSSYVWPFDREEDE